MPVASAAPTPRTGPSGAPASPPGAPSSSPRVLLATPDAETAAAVRRALDGTAVVGTAGSLPALRQALRGGDVAAVLCDLPVLSAAPGLAGELHALLPAGCLVVLGDPGVLPEEHAAAVLAECFAVVDRPLRRAALTTVVASALRHHQLVADHRTLLERTLPGLVEAFVESLATGHPVAYRRTTRTVLLVAEVARRTGTPLDWRLRLAALVSQLGSFAVPQEILQKVERVIRLPFAERRLYHGHLALTRRLLDGVPLLDEVADWTGRQPGELDDLRVPVPEPLTGAAACFDVAAAFLAGYDLGLASRDIAARLAASGRYEPAMVDAVLDAADVLSPKGDPRALPVGELVTGMVLAKDVRTTSGILLVRRGELVTSMLVDRLRSFAVLLGVAEPVTVFAPGHAGAGPAGSVEPPG